MSFVAELVAYLGEIEYALPSPVLSSADAVCSQEVYVELRAALLERLYDKEPLIRAHCVVAMSKLALSEDPKELDEDEQPLLVCLLTSLCCDPAVYAPTLSLAPSLTHLVYSSEVRRAAVINLPFTPSTLPALLTRSRDIDAVTRKLVYSTVLPRLSSPKQLTIAQREHVVQVGLGDREEAVRLATGKLLGAWVDACEGSLSAFLRLFDVRSTEICIDALKSVFVTRAEVVQEIEFDGEAIFNFTE